MADCISLQWQGLTFPGAKTDGAPWIADLDGWEGLPDTRSDAADRPGAHGSFDTPVLASARMVTASGLCTTASERDELLLALQAAMTLHADPEPLTITAAGRTLTARARLTRAKPTLTGGRWGNGIFGWAAQWRCADPYRYGPTQTETTGLPMDAGGLRYPLYTDGAGTDVGFLDYGDYGTEGTVTVTNPGSAEGWARFSVDGPAPGGFTIVETTTHRRLIYTGAIAASSTVSIDSASGLVALDGVPRPNQLVFREWTPVPPGGSLSFSLQAPSGDPHLTVEVTETWW